MPGHWLLIAFLALGLLNACNGKNIPTPEIASSPSIEPTRSPTVTVCPTSGSPGTVSVCNPDLNQATPVSGVSPSSPLPKPPQVLELTQTPARLPTELVQTAMPTSLASTTTLFLARPIAVPNNDQVDPSYRFGSSQNKKRDPHHGVEFLNPQGTPVLAAADGVVVIAGDDKKTLYSPYYNYYGNLVVIQHDLPSTISQDFPNFPQPIYTLYAHLSEILVKAGDQVKQGQEIGKVGMTGGATGSHLHFEVRLGENTYAASRNPELWLAPGLGDSGQPRGALAGRVIDAQGRQVAVKGIVIQHLPDGPGGLSDGEIYLDSYEEKALRGNAPWEESFGVGDLPAGWYRINFPYGGLQRQEVQVFPDQVTLAEFKVQ